MWVTAILGTASKFVECTLSTHFRNINEESVVSGGPMYYIEKGLGREWKFLAVMFAACAVISSFGSGNSVQAFTVADSFRSDFGIIHFLGAIFSLEIVWGFGDTALGLMAIPNLIAILALSGVARRLAVDYFSRPQRRFKTTIFKR